MYNELENNDLQDNVLDMFCRNVGELGYLFLFEKAAQLSHELDLFAKDLRGENYVFSHREIVPPAVA